MTPHTKLFIPGPVEVSPKTLAAFGRPMIGHRGGDFKALYATLLPRLQALFGTRQPVFLAQLHVRRVLRQMARREQTLRQTG